MPELWNIRKLCEVFQKNRQTIYRWIKTGKLPKPNKKLGTPFWDAEDIKKILKT